MNMEKKKKKEIYVKEISTKQAASIRAEFSDRIIGRSSTVDADNKSISGGRSEVEAGLPAGLEYVRLVTNELRERHGGSRGSRDVFIHVIPPPCPVARHTNRPTALHPMSPIYFTRWPGPTSLYAISIPLSITFPRPPTSRSSGEGGRISMHTGFGERVIRHRNHVLPRERSSVQIAEASSRLSISLLSVNSLPTGISFRLTIIFSKPRPPPIIPSLFYPTYPSPTKGSGPHNFLLLLSSSREDSSQKSRIALVFQPGGQ